MYRASSTGDNPQFLLWSCRQVRDGRNLVTGHNSNTLYRQLAVKGSLALATQTKTIVSLLQEDGVLPEAWVGSVASEDFGRMFDKSFPACVFFFFF